MLEIQEKSWNWFSVRMTKYDNVRKQEIYIKVSWPIFLILIVIYGLYHMNLCTASFRPKITPK